MTTVIDPGFADAVGTPRPIRLRVEHDSAGVLAEGELDQPFAVIGSAPECDVCLNDPTIPPRAAVLQGFDGRTFLFPFDTLTPTPLAPDRPWQLGEFRLSRTDDHPAGPTDAFREDADGPRVSLELAGQTVRLTRRITFVGRSAACGIRSDEPDVADVHAYLLLTGNGAWVVDLLSEADTRVNDQAVRAARLNDGDELQVGSCQMAVRIDVWGEVIPSSAPPVRDQTGPEPPPSDLFAPPQPHFHWTDDDPVDLVPLAPAPQPEVAPPPQADPNTLAVFQYVAAMHGHLMTEFRRSMDELTASFGQMQQQQMQAVQAELNRLAELNVELHRLRIQATPVSPPASVPPPHPAVDPADTLANPVETPSRYQWVAERLAEIEAERGGIWDRIRGMFNRPTSRV